ncbi:MAG: dimethyl sulfoxide reductase anchor subunit family protein [Coriobacteriia bacterium]
MDVQWALVFFTLFVGLGVGLFVALAVAEWRGAAKEIRFPAAAIALVALAIGGFSSVLHLGHPGRIFGALGHPTSGIFLEMLLIGLTGIGIIVYLAMARRSSDSSLKAVAAVTSIPAIILSFAVGYSYVVPARPAWDTFILPLLYVASAAVMGCIALSLIAAVKKDADTTRGGAMAALISLAVQAVLVIAYLVYLGSAPFADASRSAGRLISGDLAVLFWIGLVLFGLAVPLALSWLLRTKKEGGLSPLTGATLGLVSVLVGGVAFRALMFALGTGIKSYFGGI